MSIFRRRLMMSIKKNLNLFDSKNPKYVQGYITINGSSISYSTATDTFYIECKPNTTYILTRKNYRTSNQVFRMGTSTSVPVVGSRISGIVGGLTNVLSLTITTDSTAKYLAFSEGTTKSTNTDLDKFTIFYA